MARFYVVQKSDPLWRGDSWEPIAGPFTVRKDAEVEAEKYEYGHVGKHGLFIKGEMHAKVVSRTWLRRRGYPTTPEGESRLVAALQCCKHGLLLEVNETCGSD